MGAWPDSSRLRGGAALIGRLASPGGSAPDFPDMTSDGSLSRAGPMLLGALAPLTFLVVDPAGWYPFGPVKWLSVSVLGFCRRRRRVGDSGGDGAPVAHRRRSSPGWVHWPSRPRSAWTRSTPGSARPNATWVSSPGRSARCSSWPAARSGRSLGALLCWSGRGRARRRWGRHGGGARLGARGARCRRPADGHLRLGRLPRCGGGDCSCRSASAWPQTWSCGDGFEPRQWWPCRCSWLPASGRVPAPRGSACSCRR